MTASPEMRWSPARLDKLCALKRQGLTNGQIAIELGASRNSVAGYIDRLRKAGDTRLPPAGPTPIGAQRAATRATAAAPHDRLAQLMADGCPSLTEAAYKLRLSIDRVQTMWAKIRRDLGPQAS